MTSVLEREQAVMLADFFTAMSDPTRVQIISLLAEPDAELPVQAIADALGMTHSAVSHQLRLLRGLRVVKTRQAGRHVFYSLDDDHIKRVYHEGLDHVLHG